MPPAGRLALLLGVGLTPPAVRLALLLRVFVGHRPRLTELRDTSADAEIRNRRKWICPDGFPRPASNTDLPISGICRSPGIGYLCVTDGTISGLIGRRLDVVFCV